MTRNKKADFGVVISASHNPPQFNGIKIFGSDGFKIPDATENLIEKHLLSTSLCDGDSVGRIIDISSEKSLYADFLYNSSLTTLEGIKVVLDMSNGASYKVAPEVFNRLGATVIPTHYDIEKGKINDHCGCLFPEIIKQKVIEENADVGFAFDGDSDRVIVCDSQGEIINGDMIVYILAKMYKESGKLVNDTVIGTLHTNMGIENKFKSLGIKFLRSDIGDKYVLQEMQETGAVVGGEQSGHIIMGDKSTTGDGVLCAIVLSSIIAKKKEPLVKLLEGVKQFPQENINVTVPDKKKVLSSPLLKTKFDELNKKIEGKGRILVRASGTEPKIRIMAECDSAMLSFSVARELADLVNDIANLEV